MRRFLITGGAGFVSSTLAASLKEWKSDSEIWVLDNLKRRGSELNLNRLRAAGINFVHGDIRAPEDFGALKAVDCVIECSAEPAVLAGYQGSAQYVIQTNLMGTVNCLEWARQHG